MQEREIKSEGLTAFICIECDAAEAYKDFEVEHKKHPGLKQLPADTSAGHASQEPAAKRQRSADKKEAGEDGGPADADEDAPIAAPTAAAKASIPAPLTPADAYLPRPPWGARFRLANLPLPGGSPGTPYQCVHAPDGSRIQTPVRPCLANVNETGPPPAPETANEKGDQADGACENGEEEGEPAGPLPMLGESEAAAPCGTFGASPTATTQAPPAASLRPELEHLAMPDNAVAELADDTMDTEIDAATATEAQTAKAPPPLPMGAPIPRGTQLRESRSQKSRSKKSRTQLRKIRSHGQNPKAQSRNP